MTRQRLNLSLAMGSFLFGILITYVTLNSFVSQEGQNTIIHQTNNGFSKRAVKNDVLKFGNPGPVSDLLERTAYTVSYNRRDRIAHWSGEHLTASGIVKGPGVDRDKSDFKEDTSLPAPFRSRLNDYRGSGYDRGHQTPAGDAGATQAALDETFLLSNMAPQVGAGFNREYWAYFEGFVRDLTKNFTDVYVFTGPLFLPQSSNGASILGTKSIKLDGTKVAKSAAPSSQTTYNMNYKVIGSGGAIVAVPTHFYKVLLTVKDGKYTTGAFVLPNEVIKKTTELSEFQVDQAALEQASGLQFFTELSSTDLTNLCEAVRCVV